jgi:hypothetical protein
MTVASMAEHVSPKHRDERRPRLPRRALPTHAGGRATQARGYAAEIEVEEVEALVGDVEDASRRFVDFELGEVMQVSAECPTLALGAAALTRRRV